MFNKFTGVSLLAFQNAFSNNNDCIKYLSEIKWSVLVYLKRECPQLSYQGN